MMMRKVFGGLFFGFCLLAIVNLAVAQPVVAPSDFTNRPLDLPGDASSVGWNPAVLGLGTETDVIVGFQYDPDFDFERMTYGAFAKTWYVGAGTIGTSESFRLQNFYAGFGFPINVVEDIPLSIGAGLAWGYGGSPLDDGSYMLGATSEPVQDLLLGLSVFDLLSNKGDPFARFDAHYSPLDWLGVRGSLLINRPELLTSETSTRPLLGLDIWLFEHALAVTGTFDIDREDLRVGIELLIGPESIVGSLNTLQMETGNVDFSGGLATYRFRPTGATPYEPSGPLRPGSTRLGWAPDRAYKPEGIDYAHEVSDATEDPSALQRPCNTAPTGFDSPVSLYETVRRGGSDYKPLSDALAALDGEPADIFKNIRKTFYSRRIRSRELADSDSLKILSNQGYSIGMLNIDNSDFPNVGVYMQVTDNEGRSVRGLGKDDFRFADPSFEIVSVRPIDSSRRIPVDVTLIIDCSGSMGGEIESVRQNAQRFVDHMESSGADYRIGGVLYGSIIYDTLHPTDDFSRFRDFVSHADAIGGDEISTLAIKAATEMNYRPDAQRAFIVITDDWVVQLNSKLKEADLVSMLWDTKARLYTIGNLCENNAAVTTRLTLGSEYDVTSPFNSILDDIGTDITTTYELVYKSKLKEIPKVTILRGRVRDESGKPASVDIRLGESLNNSSLSVPTNQTTGEYEVEIVEGKVYQAEIDKDPYLRLKETVDLSAVEKGDTVVRNFTLQLPQTTLRGQILDQNDRGVQGTVQIDDAETLETVAVVETDFQGRYSTEIDEGREYRLTPEVREHIPTPEVLDTRGVRKGTQLEKNLHVISIDEAIATGATFRLNNIFFDFDKANLKDESIPELQKLVDLLNEYPTVNVEIGAHTDSRGSDEYNVGLSQRRAQSVVDWLIEQGIGKNRLVSKGYGETQPVATNDTDEGRALNRRVEFKLVR